MTEQENIDKLVQATTILNEYRKALTESVKEMGKNMTQLDARVRHVENNGSIKNELNLFEERLNNISTVTTQKLDKLNVEFQRLNQEIANKDNQIGEINTNMASLVEGVDDAKSFKVAVKNFVKELMK
ncbi:MAG: hypothetical protein DRN81_02135 [Thermoproteota archaeon]|nr:MAG: hypothetical protein DRN81_02135 [Candidatus Korarchaeota archaeon]